MGFFSGGKTTQSFESNSWSGLDKAALPQWEQMWGGLQQGIAPWQMAGFDQAIRSAGTRFSGLNAARGGLTPYSLPQIASSAAQYVTPQFALANTSMLGNLLNMRQIATSTSRGSMRQTAPGIGYTFGSALARSAGNSLGQWLAPKQSTGPGDATPWGLIT